MSEVRLRNDKKLALLDLTEGEQLVGDWVSGLQSLVDHRKDYGLYFSELASQWRVLTHGAVGVS